MRMLRVLDFSLQAPYKTYNEKQPMDSSVKLSAANLISLEDLMHLNDNTECRECIKSLTGKLCHFRADCFQSILTHKKKSEKTEKTEGAKGREETGEQQIQKSLS